MIEFKGELTGECRKFFLRVQRKINLQFTAIVSILFLTAIILLGVFLNPIVLCGLIAIPLIFVLALFSPSKGEEKKITPKRIYIDTEEKTIVLECNAQERFHMINSVEKVLDYGDWYHFVFRFEDRDPYFICQKNLLAQGSLAEFEALFAGKLEKRKL